MLLNAEKHGALDLLKCNHGNEMFSTTKIWQDSVLNERMLLAKLYSAQEMRKCGNQIKSL